MRLRIVILLLSIFLIPRSAPAQDEFYPFLAEVVADSVNIRAGQSTGFEKLGKLEKGDDIIVVAREYSWYKIQLPARASSFISNQYVELTDSNKGLVTAKRVNVRARASTGSTVLGKAMSGDEVAIVEHLPNWYKIQPVKESYGWILDKFLAFKSSDITEYKEEVVVAKAQEEPAVEELEIIEEPAPVVEEVKNDIKVTGSLKRTTSVMNGPIHNFYVDNGATKYYLNAPGGLLIDYVDYQVRVQGQSSFETRGDLQYPVINVTELQLVL